MKGRLLTLFIFCKLVTARFKGPPSPTVACPECSGEGMHVINDDVVTEHPCYACGQTGRVPRGYLKRGR